MQKLRLNIFSNGDYLRKQGKVIVVNTEDTTFPQFLQQCATKLNLKNAEETNIKIFTEQGGEVSSFDELLNNDVLFVENNGEEFKNFELNLSSSLSASMTLTNSSQRAGSPFSPSTATLPVESSPGLQQQPGATTAAPRMLVVHIKPLESLMREIEAEEKQSSLDGSLTSSSTPSSTSQTATTSSNNTGTDRPAALTPAKDGIKLYLKHRAKTILYLKEKVKYKYFGFHPKDQIFVYQGQNLLDEKKIEEYFPYNMSSSMAISSSVESINTSLSSPTATPPEDLVTVYLVIKPLQIFIKTTQSNITTMLDKHTFPSLQPWSTVQYLKQCYSKKVSSKTLGKNIDLIFEGKTLMDSKRLADYGIHSGCVMFATH